MSTRQDAKKDEIKTESVVLIADHKHAGAKRLKGESIDVSPVEKEWLIAHKLIAAAVAVAPKE